MARLIPVLLVLCGLIGGVGAGWVLRPDPDPDPAQDIALAPARPEAALLTLYEFPNQFLIPIMTDQRITSVIVINLALEITAADRDTVLQNAPRLRDRILQVMFDHANMGGFHGVFTANSNLGLLRQNALEAAQAVLGPEIVVGVLITDILRSGA